MLCFQLHFPIATVYRPGVTVTTKDYWGTTLAVESVASGGSGEWTLTETPPNFNDPFMNYHGYYFDVIAPNSGYVGGTGSLDGRITTDFEIHLYLVPVAHNGDNNGNVPCRSEAGRPVNVTNGNVYLTQTDFDLLGFGPGIKVARTYNSSSVGNGLFGLGWSTTLDESIVSTTANEVLLTAPDGKTTYFTGSGNVFSPMLGDIHAQILKEADGAYTLIFLNGETHRFNAIGKLVSITDLNNLRTTLAYDTNGRIASATDAYGRILTFATSSGGNVLSISDTLGTIATYTYNNGDHTLTSVTYPDNSKYNFVYNGNAILESVTDALGNTLESHAYDGQRRALTSVVNGGVESFTFNYLNGETDVTDALGHVTKYFYISIKGRNVVTRIEGNCSCGGASLVNKWAYDDHLNLITQTDGLNHPKTFTYDSDGNVLTETDAAGTVSFTYNSLGEPLTRTDQMSGVTAITYDSKGNLLTLKDALNKTTTFTRDSLGRLSSLADPLAHTTTFEYDPNVNLQTRTDAMGGHTHFVYDVRGRLTSLTDAINQTTSYQYDLMGRVSRVTQPDGSYVNNTYDLAGRTTGVSDARNTLEPTQAPTPGPSPTPTPVSAGNVLISEFRLRGPNGPNDEFVELYNNTDSVITVRSVDGSSGWIASTQPPPGGPAAISGRAARTS